MEEHKTMSHFANKEDFYLYRIAQIKKTMTATEDGMRAILASMARGELTTAGLKTSLANLIAISEKGRGE